MSIEGNLDGDPGQAGQNGTRNGCAGLEVGKQIQEYYLGLERAYGAMVKV